jgi:hypothetical protein
MFDFKGECTRVKDHQTATGQCWTCEVKLDLGIRNHSKSIETRGRKIYPCQAWYLFAALPSFEI